jgi:hypothetical protein
MENYPKRPPVWQLVAEQYPEQSRNYQ